jgi:polar amino acid transport system substrate-binding protein
MARCVSLLVGIAFAVLGAGHIAIAQDFQFEAQPLIKDCGDGSYDKAVKDGITLGIAPSPLYSGIDPQTKNAYGLDVEINQGALSWLGIKKINYEIMPFSQLIAALLANRIDVIAINIHYTPERMKVISFTGPAWWYGPGLIVKKGNPTGLKSFEELKGKEVGAMAGTSADEYLQHIGATVVPFRQNPDHFAAVTQGRIAAVMDDDVKFLAYMKANPTEPLEMIPNVTVPDELIYKYGYGYARYALRKEDCSLRVAYTSALAEIRGNGMVSAILKKNGLSNRNLFFFPTN